MRQFSGTPRQSVLLGKRELIYNVDQVMPIALQKSFPSYFGQVAEVKPLSTGIARNANSPAAITVIFLWIEDVVRIAATRLPPCIPQRRSVCNRQIGTTINPAIAESMFWYADLGGDFVI